MILDLLGRWEAAARLIADNRDVLDARPGDGDENEAPRALRERGWEPYLSALDETRVVELEVRGHEASWSRDAPTSLVAMVAAAREVCALPTLTPAGESGESGGAIRSPRRLETPRKRAQVDAFASLALPAASDATRVVDVGSGHGHLTRAIAERIGLPVVGLERDATLAERARGLPSSAALEFAVTDVLRDGLAVAPGDCVIGLHVCGELGDAIVESVARVGPGAGPERGEGVALAVVGCCLQKRRALSRSPLCASPLDRFREALDLPRRLLGLSNLTARDDGVEASRAENLAGRERRLALHRLLSLEGHAVGGLRLGAEIEGLNRRVAHGELPSLVARAFALRGQPPPSRAAIAQAAAWAAVQHARARRLSLPRTMLARVLEVFVLFDRALYLERCGFDATVGAAFPLAVSARNLAIVARAPRRHWLR